MLIDRLINLLSMIIANKRILNNQLLYDVMTSLDRQIEIFISNNLYLVYLDEKNKLYDKSISNNSEELNNTDEFMIIIQQLIDDLKNKANN